MKRVEVWIEDGLLKEIEKRAKKFGLKRSECVRFLLVQSLKEKNNSR